MTLKLTLITWLFLLLVGHTANAQETDEPGIQPLPVPFRPVPAPLPQYVDPESIEVVEITPLPAPSMTPVLQRAPSRPRQRGPFFTLDAGASYGGYAMIFGESVSGPLITTSLAMTFGSGRARHGLRLGGYYGMMNGDYDGLFDGEGSSQAETRLYGVNLGYMLQVGGFWLSAGWGAVHISSRLDGRSSDFYDYDYNDNEDTLPEGVLALGYDIRFSEHLGLRLGAEMGTFFVSWRGQLGGSLVLRF